MVVAVISAVRTSWKDEGNQKDEWYFWRNAHSNIWYSSEIVGTIIVQCIPVLRPLIRDIKTSLTSKKLASSGDELTRRSRYVREQTQHSHVSNEIANVAVFLPWSPVNRPANKFAQRPIHFRLWLWSRPDYRHEIVSQSTHLL